MWRRWQTDVIDVVKEWNILSIAWKWLGDDKTRVLGLDDFPLYKRDREDDGALIKKIAELLDQADIVIGHNLRKFDLPRIRSRMLVAGLSPPRPAKIIDTLAIARRYFNFSSNKLNDLCQQLGLGQKVAHDGAKTWLDVLNGDKKAWSLMKKYNAMDVTLTELLYRKLAPYDEQHPRMKPAPTRVVVSNGVVHCPVCDSTNTIKRGWKHFAKTSRQQNKCNDCGRWLCE